MTALSLILTKQFKIIANNSKFSGKEVPIIK